MPELKISVVIPVYNGEKYIRKTLQSALDQDRPADEIVVVDDGSDDKTSAILASFAKHIITRRIPNGGVADAMNLGVEMASGDVIAFLDADDIWFRSKLRRQAEILEKHDDVGLVGCNYVVRYPHLRRRMVRHFSAMKHPENLNFDAPMVQDAFRALSVECFLGTSSMVMVRKQLLQKTAPFDSRYRICGDYDRWLRCALHTRFYLISDVLMFKRTHPQNLTSSYGRVLAEHREVLKRSFEFNRDRIRREGWESQSRDIMADIAYQTGNLRFEDRKFGEAYRHYREGLGTSPNVKNAARFIWTILKKTLRLCAGGRRLS